MGVSGPGHSSVMRRAATMYGQSCRVVGRGGVGPLRFGGAQNNLGELLRLAETLASKTEARD